MEDFWADAEVISVYSDKQAVEDGQLVDLEELFGGQVMFRGQSVNRMTSNLFEQMRPFMLAFFDDDEDEWSPTAIRNLRHTLQTKLRYAFDTADPGSERGVHFQLPPNLWMVANDTGGWTVMFPEDY